MTIQVVFKHQPQLSKKKVTSKCRIYLILLFHYSKKKKEEKNIALAKKKKNHVQHKKIQEPKKSYEFKYANKQCNKKKK